MKRAVRRTAVQISINSLFRRPAGRLYGVPWLPCKAAWRAAHDLHPDDCTAAWQAALVVCLGLCASSGDSFVPSGKER